MMATLTSMQDQRAVSALYQVESSMCFSSTVRACTRRMETMQALQGLEC